MKKDHTENIKNNPFSGLSKVQKLIINQIVTNDYYILITYDIRYKSTEIILTDEWGNDYRYVKEITLQNLLKRGFIKSEDVSKCLELIQTKYTIKEKYAEQALNACI